MFLWKESWNIKAYLACLLGFCVPRGPCGSPVPGSLYWIDVFKQSWLWSSLLQCELHFLIDSHYRIGNAFPWTITPFHQENYKMIVLKCAKHLSILVALHLQKIAIFNFCFNPFFLAFGHLFSKCLWPLPSMTHHGPLSWHRGTVFMHDGLFFSGHVHLESQAIMAHSPADATPYAVLSSLSVPEAPKVLSSGY